MAFRRITIVSGSSLCAAALWLIAGGVPRSVAAEIPEPVRQALESNARALSPITVAWERTRTTDLSQPGLRSLVGETATLLLPRRYRFMWENGRIYCYIESFAPPSEAGPDGRLTFLTGRPLIKQEVEVTFDGQKRYCGTRMSDPQPKPPSLTIDRPSTLASRGENVRFAEAEFLHEAGFHIPETTEDYVAKRPVKSLPLSLVEQGARVVEVGSERVDGVECTALVLRSGTAEYRFVLDPAKRYALRRRIEKTPPGELAVQADCSDFTQVPGSALWMPKKVEVEWHTWPEAKLRQPVKEAVIREAFRVSELKSEPIPPERFVLNYGSGSYIGDSSLEGADKDPSRRVTYRVPADPAYLDEVIKAAKAGKDYSPESRSTVRRHLIVNVLFILVVMGIAWRWSRRKSS